MCIVRVYCPRIADTQRVRQRALDYMSTDLDAQL